ncbi:MAG: radical SAM protein [Candidatus Delongbacteria bacterium]|nr:radical SAM protein [Candidatus Delongbacteria bacterium]
MKDNYNRNITYLRISITDRCNLRCTYCMPEEGVDKLSHKDLLSFEEIVEFTKQAVAMGINKVRLTGGEPLVRKGIVDLVKMLWDIDGIKDLALTTNAVLLKEYAQPLKDAGLQRLNISLDTLDKERFAQITRRDKLEEVLAGIDEAIKVGFKQIKLNCVIEKTKKEPDAVAVAKYAEDKGLQARFIRTMNLEKGEFWIVDGGDGGNCSICNRIRLSSSGDVLPCLFSDLGYNIREFGNKEAILQALEHKPQKGTISKKNEFYTVGG